MFFSYIIVSRRFIVHCFVMLLFVCFNQFSFGRRVLKIMVSTLYAFANLCPLARGRIRFEQFPFVFFRLLRLPDLSDLFYNTMVAKKNTTSI